MATRTGIDEGCCRQVVREVEPDQTVWLAATENKPLMRKLVDATWRTVARLPARKGPGDFA